MNPERLTRLLEYHEIDVDFKDEIHWEFRAARKRPVFLVYSIRPRDFHLVFLRKGERRRWLWYRCHPAAKALSALLPPEELARAVAASLQYKEDDLAW